MTDTIALMRKRVLDMAIRGELVKQREEEGTAEEIYQYIHSIKEALIKSGKVKKEKKLPEIEAEVVPFDIPRSWKWLRLGEVSTLLNGDRGKNYPGKAYWTDEGIPFINAGTLNNKYLDSRNMNFIPEERYKLLRSGFVEKDDIIYCLRGSLGKISINKKFERGAIASSVVIIRTNENIDVEYLYYLLVSNYAEKLIQKVNTGTAQPNISARNVSEYEIPLPPLQEQKRIVTKIEEIFAVIDQIGERKQDSRAIIENIRQTSLQNAISGQLVEQDENDESASELVKKIQAEKEQLIKEKKIKNEKTLPDIAEDDISFEIPESWEWTKLGTVGYTNIGLTYSPADKSEEGTIVLRSSNIQNGKMDYSDIVKVNKKIPESKLCFKGDLLICARNGSKRLVGKTAIIDTDGHSFGAFMALYRSSFNQYVYHYMNSNFFRSLLGESGTTTINQITQNMLINFVIPLPPLAEQQRIVEKLDQIMTICDRMESILDGSSQVDQYLKVAD